MTTDIVLDETVKFIRSSPGNVELALAVERGMVALRNRVYGRLMSALNEHLEGSKGTWHVTLVYPGKRKQGKWRQLEGIRLHQKINWTSKGNWGGVWFARNDAKRVVYIGVTGIKAASSTTKEALAAAFGVAVRRDEDQMDEDVAPEETLLAKSDDEIKEFAGEVATQMMRLVQVIKDS